jgi:sulfate-transporting ATPase
MRTVLLYLVLSLPLVGAYCLLGLGITVIYQASRVLNLAHGAMAMLAAYTVYQCSLWHVPLVAAVACGLIVGALLGLLVERVFVRRLRAAGPTTQTVGTVGALTLSIALVSRIWGTFPVTAPRILPSGVLRIGTGFVPWSLLGIFPVAMAGAAILFGLMQFTDIGLAMRGAAQNRRGAALRGVDPDKTAMLAWVLGGAFAGLAGILFAGASSLDPFGISLGVLPAFVAALIGGLNSMTGVCVGAAIVGIVEGMVPALGPVPHIGSIAQSQGAPELVLGVLALVAMALRGARLVATDVRAEGLGAAAAAPPARVARAQRGTRARSRGAAIAVPLTLLLVWPMLPVSNDILNTAILACEYFIAALSLVLLIGLVGQISLCQAALIGMGAFIGAIATHRLGAQFPVTLFVGAGAGALSAAILGVVALRVRGLYLAVATMIFAFVCDQYLFRQPWLVESQSGTSIPFQTIGHPGTLPFFDLGDPKVFYFVALAVAVTSLYAVANLRDSSIGRAFAAVRGSEVAAASLGINVVRIKLLGFACAGALAGLSGSLLLTYQRTVAPEQFDFVHSLYFLAIAVVGGLRSFGGAIASAVMFAVLVDEVFYRWPTLSNYLDLVSALLLIGVLLFFRGGLGAVPQRLTSAMDRLRPRALATLEKVAALRPRRAVLAHELVGAGPVDAQTSAAPRASMGLSLLKWVRGVASVPTRRLRKRPTAEPNPTGVIDVDALTERFVSLAPEPQPVVHLVIARTEERAQEAVHEPDDDFEARFRAASARGEVAGERGADGRREPLLLDANGITVRFGGLTAVDDASLQVGAGEIVGLIGPNGAGKTTLFNSILGLNQPASGAVQLFGHDVTRWDVHRRAALGVGRTFQILQLFTDLTVFDNLLVATHLQNRSGFWRSVVESSGAREAERRARRRVRSVLKLMQLDHVADREVSGLPFGTLRLVEVARTLVTGARLVCFDEPASGLDSAETERLLDWFRFLRQIGVTLLVIEHDVSFVVRLCDWIYVLDQGRLLASGPPMQIQRDPAVIASYLGAPIEAA